MEDGNNVRCHISVQIRAGLSIQLSDMSRFCPQLYPLTPKSVWIGASPRGQILKKCLDMGLASIGIFEGPPPAGGLM